MSYKHIPAQCNLLQLMQDTSYNDTLRHHERRREFNVSGLKRLAALAVERSELDIITDNAVMNLRGWLVQNRVKISSRRTSSRATEVRTAYYARSN